MFFYHPRTYCALGLFAWASFFFFMYSTDDITDYGTWLGHRVKDIWQCAALHACIVIWRLAALTYQCGLEKYMTNVVFQEENGGMLRPYLAIQVFANTSCVFKLTNNIIWMHLVASMNMQYMITAYVTDMMSTFYFVHSAIVFKDTWIRAEAIAIDSVPLIP